MCGAAKQFALDGGLCLLIVFVEAQCGQYKHDNRNDERKHFIICHSDHLLGKEARSEAPSFPSCPGDLPPGTIIAYVKYIRQELCAFKHHKMSLSVKKFTKMLIFDHGAAAPKHSAPPYLAGRWQMGRAG